MIDGDTKNLKYLYKNGDITKSEYEKRLKAVKDTESKMTRLSTMNAKDRNSIAKYYAQSKQSLTEKWNRKILNDQKAYGKNSKEVTRDEAAKKKALQQQELKFATQVSGKEARLHTTLTGKIRLATKAQESILKKLSNTKKKLSKNQLNQAIIDSNKEYRAVKSGADKQYKSVVSAAQKKYAKTVAAAKAEYKGNTKYAKNQRAKIEEHARKQRDHAISAAEKQRKDTTQKAKSQYNDTVDYAHKQNKGVTKQSAEEYKNTKENNAKQKDNYHSTWHGIWKTVGNWVGKMISGLNKGAIKGQNKVFSQYGGTNTLSPISASYFASGTGMFSNMRRAITKPTLAVLNDGTDSPETNNQEAIFHPNGDAELVHGRNTMKWLEPGAEIANASELKILQALGVTHFANGTGIFSGLAGMASKVGGWFKKAFGSLKQKLAAIGGFIKDPDKSFASTFNPDMGAMKGTVAKNYAHLVNTKIKNQGKKWWSAAWNVIDGVANAGGGGGPVLHSPGAGWHLSSGFGGRKGASGSGYDSHDGNDFSGGKTVHALQDSIVTRIGGAPAGWGGARGIGESIATKGGKLSLIYQELNGKNNSGADILVHTGDHIKQGQAIAKLGPAGTHVHIGASTQGLWGHGGGSTRGWLDVTKLHGNYGNKASKKKGASTGLTKFVNAQLKGAGVLSWVKKYLAPLSDDAGGAEGNPGGHSVARWRPYVVKALKANGFSASASQVSAWMRVIARESNGDPTVVNRWDSNAKAGHPSKGLVQTIEPTFRAYAFKGHNRILNGYDDLLAGINYAKHRYGRGASMFTRVATQGYANGGLSTKEKLAPISEGNMPEMVIPLSQMKASRGYELLGKTAAIMAKRDHINGAASQPTDDGAVSKLSDKLDAVVGLLSQLVSGQANPVPAVIGESNVVNVINKHNKRVKTNRNLGRGTPFG